MIENFVREHATEEVFRLSSIPMPLREALLRRNMPEDSIDDAIESISVIGTPTTVEEAVAYPFRVRQDSEIPYRDGRFGDGREYPVYYSALEQGTCVQEITYHLELDRLRPESRPFPRYYHLIASSFGGDTLNLLGHEIEHPELVSKTRDGYPFCQRLAAKARAAAIHALRTRSARKPDGVCFPIFAQEAISQHRTVRQLRMIIGSTGVEVDPED